MTEQNEWTFTPEDFPVLGPVWASIAHHLADGSWHPLSDVVAVAVANGAHPKTAKELIRRGRQAHRIDQRGAWQPRTQTDGRSVRLAGGPSARPLADPRAPAWRDV